MTKFVVDWINGKPVVYPEMDGAAAIKISEDEGPEWLTVSIRPTEDRAHQKPFANDHTAELRTIAEMIEAQPGILSLSV